MGPGVRLRRRLFVAPQRDRLATVDGRGGHNSFNVGWANTSEKVCASGAVACLVAVLATISSGGCSSSSAKSVDAAREGGGDAGSIVAARPYNFKLPSGYDRNNATPLVIDLHGYAVSGVGQEGYFQFGAIADEQTFLYAYPDGTLDLKNNRFWNADDACCNFFAGVVDDVAYLNAMIDDISTRYNVDPKRIFIVGHSNGAFMSHRLACDLSDRVAAIASLAGATWNDASKCNPSNHVSVLDVHGDADTVINYGGGSVPADLFAPGDPPETQPPYPSEAETMATWAAKNGCTDDLTPNVLTLDLDTMLAGAETSESAYAGCPTGVDVELWTIHGGSHVPSLASPTWAESIYAFLKAHPKP
jgi:polyhydroxybutyrate depolymerase